jgi:hypothetical protein
LHPTRYSGLRPLLRAIFDKLLAGPARRENLSAQLGQFVFGDLDLEGAYLASGLDAGAHDDLLFLVAPAFN